jgi:hypothetical protein
LRAAPRKRVFVDFEADATGMLYVKPNRCSPGIDDDLRR